MENPTTDLSKFGYIELKEAARLLTAYTESDKPEFLGDGVTVAFNTSSGNVFLTDEDYNVGMMNGDKLEQWFSCPNCGHEGFKEDMLHSDDPECVEYLEEIGVVEKNPI